MRNIQENIFLCYTNYNYNLLYFFIDIFYNDDNILLYNNFILLYTIKISYFKIMKNIYL